VRGSGLMGLEVVFRGVLMQWGDEMEELFRIFASLSIVYDIDVLLFTLPCSIRIFAFLHYIKLVLCRNLQHGRVDERITVREDAGKVVSVMMEAFRQSRLPAAGH